MIRHQRRNKIKEVTTQEKRVGTGIGNTALIVDADVQAGKMWIISKLCRKT